MGYYVKKSIVLPPSTYVPKGYTSHVYRTPDEIHIKDAGSYKSATEVWVKNNGTYCKVWPETRATHTSIANPASGYFNPTKHPGQTLKLTATVEEAVIADTDLLPLDAASAVAPAGGGHLDTTDPANPCVVFTKSGATVRVFLGKYSSSGHLSGTITSDGTFSVKPTTLSGVWAYNAPPPKLGDATVTEHPGTVIGPVSAGSKPLSLDWPNPGGYLTHASMYLDITSGSARRVCLSGLSLHTETIKSGIGHVPQYGSFIFETKSAVGGTWQRIGTAPLVHGLGTATGTLDFTLPNWNGDYVFRAQYVPDPAHPAPVTWLPSTSAPSSLATKVAPASTGGGSLFGGGGGGSSGPVATAVSITGITDGGKSVLGSHASSGWKSGDTLYVMGKVDNLGFGGTGKVQIQWSSSSSPGWHNWGSPLTTTFGVFSRTERVTGAVNLQFRAVFTSSDTSKYTSSTSGAATARYQAAPAAKPPAPKPPPVAAQVSLSFRSHVVHTIRGNRNDGKEKTYAYYGTYSSYWGNMWSEIFLNGSPTYTRVTGGTVTFRNAHAYLNAGADAYIYFGTVRHTVHVPKSGSVTIHLSQSEAQSLAQYKKITFRPVSTSRNAYGYVDPRSVSISLTQH